MTEPAKCANCGQPRPLVRSIDGAQRCHACILANIDRFPEWGEEPEPDYEEVHEMHQRFADYLTASTIAANLADPEFPIDPAEFLANRIELDRHVIEGLHTLAMFADRLRKDPAETLDMLRDELTKLAELLEKTVPAPIPEEDV